MKIQRHGKISDRIIECAVVIGLCLLMAVFMRFAWEGCERLYAIIETVFRFSK